MTPLIVPLPTFQGVSSNANNTVQTTTRIPGGLMLRKIILAAAVAAGNKLFTEIVNDIRLNINGKTQRLASADEINQLNTRHGADYALSESGTIGGANLVQYLTLHFREPWRVDPASNNGRIYAWNLTDVPGLEVQVEIKTGLVTPTLTGFYEYEAPDTTRGLGAITKWLRKDLGPTVTPVDVPDTFELNQANRLHAIHLFPTANGQYVTKTSLKFGSTLFLDQVDYLTQQANLIAQGITPDGSATPRYDIELDQSDSVIDTLPLGGQVSQNLKLDFSAAPVGNMHIVSEVSGNRE
jgi:hypothetical protein